MKLKNWARIIHKNTKEPSIIFADRVEYIANKQGNFFDHHLMFYLGKKLVFKVYLFHNKEAKPYKSIQDACDDVGISIREK
jgi:hypothetical protein